MRRRLVLLGACLPLVAGAQTVYRCGPAGNVYTQHPCADGREIDVSDPRTPAQAAEARAELRAQEQWARRAAQQRRAEEAAHPPALAGGIAPLPPARARPDDRPASPGRKERRPRKPVKSSDDGGFVAMAAAERSSPRRSR